MSSTTDPIAALQALDKEGAVAPYLMVRDTHGNVVFRSERLAKAEPEIGAHEVLTHAATSGLTVEQFFTVHLARGPVRFTCVPLATPSETYLQLGRPLGDVGMMLEVVRIASLVLIPIVIAITSFGGFLIARRALRPVDVIATSLESIQATDLSRRIDPHAPDIEVRRLTSSINQLLDRLGTSFKTMREFTADVSHQLQTPLTVMKGTIESARKGTPEDRAKALNAVSDEVNALTATLQDLRDLALADADSAGSRVGPVIVSEVFEEAGELVSALAEAHGVACETAIEPGLRVWGNPVRLRQLLLNLGENAVEFTPAGGRIRIEASRSRWNGRSQSVGYRRWYLGGVIAARVRSARARTGPGRESEIRPWPRDRKAHRRRPWRHSRDSEPGRCRDNSVDYAACRRSISVDVVALSALARLTNLH